jgi:phospholipid/cholesterol/gamma-HCH transport system permease protein
MEAVQDRALWQARLEGDTLRVSLSGSWLIASARPKPEDVVADPATEATTRVVVEDGGIAAWDSSLLTFLSAFESLCLRRKQAFDASPLPQGIRQLLALASAVPERSGARRAPVRDGFLASLGWRTLARWASFKDTLQFIGEAFIGLGRAAKGRAQVRREDFVLTVYECGPQALPIVTLISVLVGLVLAFVGSVQLKMFGAEIFIADAVALGMAMEMGALMTGIIMAGRTGASFAAQLGTMQVNEEIDALKTLGFSPMEFLVLPRLAAMILMMPLLCVYADLMGMLGGSIVGIFMLDITPAQYFAQTRDALELRYFAQGLIKSSVFGIVIAFTGCLRGMQCGRSAAAVGEATTSAVVTCIVLIVVSDSILTIIYNVTGFP